MTYSPKSSMVVTQGGAQAASDLPGAADYVITVTQKDDESIGDLTQRVRRALDYVSAKGIQLEQMVFVPRAGFDLADVSATADLVRHVVTHMVGVGQGEVHLAAAHGDARARYALTALSDALSEQVRGTGVHVITYVPETSETIVLSRLRRAATA